jgi:hypothetical protein
LSDKIIHLYLVTQLSRVCSLFASRSYAKSVNFNFPFSSPHNLSPSPFTPSVQPNTLHGVTSHKTATLSPLSPLWTPAIYKHVPRHLTTTLLNSTLLSPFTGRHSTAREGGGGLGRFITMMPASSATQTRHTGMWGRLSQHPCVNRTLTKYKYDREHAHHIALYLSHTPAAYSAVSLHLSDHLTAHSCPQDSVWP